MKLQPNPNRYIDCSVQNCNVENKCKHSIGGTKLKLDNRSILQICCCICLPKILSLYILTIICFKDSKQVGSIVTINIIFLNMRLYNMVSKNLIYVNLLLLLMNTKVFF